VTVVDHWVNALTGKGAKSFMGGTAARRLGLG